MFEWNEDFSVHIPSIDAQHRTLFAIARELHAAMLIGHARGALAKILDRLIQYTTMHFAHEERLMRLHQYPGLAAHQAEHEALTRQVLQLQTDFRNGRATITMDLLQFLRDWLEKHIKGTDVKYSPFLA
jgi:hemerythrin